MDLLNEEQAQELIINSGKDWEDFEEYSDGMWRDEKINKRTVELYIIR